MQYWMDELLSLSSLLSLIVSNTKWMNFFFPFFVDCLRCRMNVFLSLIFLPLLIVSTWETKLSRRGFDMVLYIFFKRYWFDSIQLDCIISYFFCGYRSSSVIPLNCLERFENLLFKRDVTLFCKTTLMSSSVISIVGCQK